jgi:hypothetical protein
VIPPIPRSAIAVMTPAAAPAFTPSSPGSASGLRVSACMSAPASPSELPTSTPSTVRGTRRSVTMTESCVSEGCSRLSSTTGSAIDFVPIARLSATTTTSAATARRIPAVRVARGRTTVGASGASVVIAR